MVYIAPMSRAPRVVSLFSGAGGMDYGFEAAGYRTAVAIEMDAACCATLERNKSHRAMQVVHRSIFDVPSSEVLALASARPREIDVVIGGPPCQPFSKSGLWARGDTPRLNDARAQTLAGYMRIVEDTLPRAVVLENVSGLAFDGKSEGLAFLRERFREINRKHGTHYQPVWQVLSAASYGVPQLRERFFLIAAREPAGFTFPEPTHAEDGGDPATGRRVEPYRTAWDALWDVVPEPHEDLSMRGKWADLLPSIPEGKNYLHHTERGQGERLFGWRRRYWSFLLKLAKDRPSWTIQAQPGPATGPFHWDNRLLSHRELCRLQTFPDRVEITGNRGAIQRQVGNAVPSLLAEVIAREVGAQLLGVRSMRGQPVLLRPSAGKPPAPRRAAPVPAKYRSLIGRHEDHPGTGKGNRAQMWQAVGT